MGTAIVAAAHFVSSAIDLFMIAVIAVGTAITVAALVLGLIKGERLPQHIRAIWLRYAAWILLALEFALAADLIDTVIAPDWQQIGQFGAIAGIRIALGFFLGRDMAEYAEKQSA